MSRIISAGGSSDSAPDIPLINPTGSWLSNTTVNSGGSEQGTVAGSLTLDSASIVSLQGSFEASGSGSQNWSGTASLYAVADDGTEVKLGEGSISDSNSSQTITVSGEIEAETTVDVETRWNYAESENYYSSLDCNFDSYAIDFGANGV